MFPMTMIRSMIHDLFNTSLMYCVFRVTDCRERLMGLWYLITRSVRLDDLQVQSIKTQGSQARKGETRNSVYICQLYLWMEKIITILAAVSFWSPCAHLFVIKVVETVRIIFCIQQFSPLASFKFGTISGEQLLLSFPAWYGDYTRPTHFKVQLYELE